jgi:hypothetical protein
VQCLERGRSVFYDWAAVWLPSQNSTTKRNEAALVTQNSRKYPALIDAKMGIDCPEQRRLDAGSASTFYEIADDLICLDGHASQEISVHG